MESLLIYEGIFIRTPTSKAQSFRIKDHVGGRLIQSFSDQDQVGGQLIFLVALPLLKHNHSAIKTKWEATYSIIPQQRPSGRATYFFSRTPTSKAQSFSDQDQVGGRLLILQLFKLFKLFKLSNSSNSSNTELF